MTAALLEVTGRAEDRDRRQPALFDDLRRAPSGPEPVVHGSASARDERHPRSGGDRLTLEAHLERIWEGLRAAGAAECLVCGELMEQVEGHGECRGCGATLS